VSSDASARRAAPGAGGPQGSRGDELAGGVWRRVADHPLASDERADAKLTGIRGTLAQTMRTPRIGSSDPTPRDPTAARAGDPASDLLLIVGHGRMTTHQLGDRELLIGRGAGCDVVVDHASLSRRHAVLRPGPPPTIQDLGSTNGTRVDRAVLQGGDPVELRGGESFHIGPFTFVLVSRDRSDLRSVSGRDLLRVVDPTPAGVPALVRDVAESPANVLILGETGVGKEVLAATLHELSGRTGELTRINCAALAENLLESELFGHEKGAFTGAASVRVGLLEAAHGGTVFLDEIGELPLGIQAKLLRAVEQREILRLGSTRPISIDVRFVAATNRDLPAEVAAGRFRSDLYFRLDGVTLAIPPLRERRGMVGPLALKFLDEACQRGGRARARLGADVLAALEAYAWPGNVRELKAVIERALLLARGGDPAVRHLAFARMTERDAPSAPPVVAPPAVAPAAPDAAPDFLTGEQRADRDRVIQILEDCAGNQTRAAKLLGISRTTLVNKIRLYRIPRPRG
jgi:two-component system, NtrC family, response regulator AtoC